jgi:hypothetical protein
VSATYRIDVQHEPHSSRYPWDAVVTRLSDDKRMTIIAASTVERAVLEAREWIVLEEGVVTFPALPVTLHVDDQGRDAEAPQAFTPRRHVGYCFTCDNGNANTFVEGKCDVCGSPEAPQSVKV